jgi:hypothetical protein
MNTDSTGKQIQYLATVVAVVSSYYALRASLLLPKFHQLLLDAEGSERPFSLGKLILSHPNWFIALVVVTLAATLFSIWKIFKYHQCIYPVCIGFQFLLAERAVSSIVDPVVQIISTMSSQ